jgi:AraC-like DNA-binding protein
MAKMNQTYLGRKFKNYTGQTPFEYILHRRIERAMVMLRAPHVKILTICMDSGFNDVSFFNRTFKRIVGMTPGKYRKQWISTAN